ncbi:MAG: hypothetical protein ABIN18_05625 [Pseudomonadota bacterium]
MPGYQSILKMVLVTMGTMWALNQLAAMNPMARKLIKGSVVAPVTNAPAGYVDNWMSI